MSVNNFKRNVYSNYVMSQLKKAHVTPELADRSYDGLISGFGSSVTFPQLGPLSATAYDGTDITVQDLNDAAAVLNIDRQYESSFQVDDFDKAQASGNLIQEGMKEAVYSIADEADAYILGLHADCGQIYETGTTPYNVTSLNIVDVLLEVGEQMDNAKIPRAGRFAILPPWVLHKAVIAGISDLTDNIPVWKNGSIGEGAGFEFFVSLNVSATNTSTWDDTKVMCGVKGKSFAYAEQVNKVEAVRRELKFKDLIKILHVYGAKLLRPDMTMTVHMDKTDEA